jgi:hypothetical protein
MSNLTLRKKCSSALPQGKSTARTSTTSSSSREALRTPRNPGHALGITRTHKHSSSNRSSSVITTRKSTSQTRTISCREDCSVIKNKKSRKDLSSHASLTLSTPCLGVLDRGRMQSVYLVSCSTIRSHMKVMGEQGKRGQVYTRTRMAII